MDRSQLPICESCRAERTLDQAFRGKRDGHGGTSPWLARQLDAAAMRFNELLRDRKSESCALIFARQRAVDLAEMLKGAVHVFFRDADARVADADGDLRILTEGGKTDVAFGRR